MIGGEFSPAAPFPSDHRAMTYFFPPPSQDTCPVEIFVVLFRFGTFSGPSAFPDEINRKG